MRKFLFLQWFIATALLFLFWTPAQAGVDPPVIKVLDGSLGQIKVDSLVTVRDAKFYESRALLQTPYRVESVVSFEVNEGLPIYLPTQFTATVGLAITYKDVNDNITTRNQQLVIGYSPTGTYTHRATFIQNGYYEVTVKVTSVSVTFPQGVTPWDVWKGLKVVNQLQSYPQYNFSYSGNRVLQVSDSAWSAGTDKDELPVWWTPSIGADEYDLEWAYIDSAALSAGIYGNDPNNPNPALIFDHNATRVSITGTAYRIPIIYDSKGHLFYRVRAVQQQSSGARYEAMWTTFNTIGHGRFDFNGHERTLNWQATTTFAEEGKRKSVVQYYDGSLRGRQTVTKDNTTQRTIVAESFYDYQGRPVVQVLPAPTLNSIIGYTPNFNHGFNKPEYDKSLFDTLPSPDAYCTLQAAPMDSLSGASQYYSGLSPFKDSGMHKYVPHAEGFPFTEVEYTQDNTGRISRQGGVGKDFRLGSGHETRYLYATPDQDELNALFGTEAGHFSHYFKNLVRDANGQYSISYVDMHGRTIATALAGTPDTASKLERLASNNPAARTEVLADPYSAVIKDLVMEHKKSLPVTTAGNHDFNYVLSPLLLKEEGCNMDSVCYNCLYDLRITITDDCNNQKLGGVPFDTLISNFSLGAIDTVCNNGTGFSVSFTKWLPEGNYEITKQLSVSRYAMEYYLDSIFMAANTCKNLDSFIVEQRAIIQAQQACKPSCQACTDSLGSWSQYWQRFRNTNGIDNVDTAVYKNMALQSYAEAKQQCEELCNKLSDLTGIRKTMLMDMTPSSGQYANIDNEQDRYSIFFSHIDSSDDNRIKDTFPAYSLVSGYLDADGNPDLVFDESSGKLVPPQDLTPEVFAQRFKSSWAETLLHLHPEYCKLQRYEQLKASHEWDRLFEGTDTYAEAKAKGYLNPLNQAGSYESLFGRNSNGRDPLSDSAWFSPKLLDSLLHFRKMTGKTLSLWGMASITVMCPEGSKAGCYNQYINTGTFPNDQVNVNAFNTTAMCTGELDMAWRSFRQLYLDIKRNLVNKRIREGCASSLTAAKIMATGHQPHFSDAAELLALQPPINKPTTKAEGEALQQQYYDDNCRAYAHQWLQDLAPCTLYDTASLNNIIIPALINICKEGSDLKHPYGSSSVKPSSTAPATHRSFEAYLEYYNSTHGISNNQDCNAYLIKAPQPYDQQAVHGNKPLYTKPDTCECGTISRLYGQYKPKRTLYGSFSNYLARVYQTDIADSTLNTLLSLCGHADFPAADCDFVSKPVFLPPVFQCNTNDICVDCSTFATLHAEFKQKFPSVMPAIIYTVGTDSTQYKWNLLYEQFMNYRLGFVKTADDYLQFKTQCDGGASAGCDSLQDIVDSFRANRQRTYGVRYELETDLGAYHRDPHSIFQNGALQLPDTARVAGGSTSIGQFITGGNFCGSDGYSTEVRYRTLGPGSGSYYANLGHSSFNVHRNTTTTGWGPPGIYLVGYADLPYNKKYGYQFGGNLFSIIYMSADTSFNWHTIKAQVTQTHYRLFFDGVQVLQIDRDSTLPILDFSASGFGAGGRYLSIDWWKVYDGNGQLRYFEDFTNPDNLSFFDPASLCPAGTVPDCQTSFVGYFNQRTGNSYTSSQIDSLYMAVCGKLPNACANSATLQQIVDSFRISRQQLYGVKTDFQTEEGEHFTDLHQLIQNGAIQLPDTVRQRPATWFNNVGISLNGGKVFCSSGGYSVEARFRFLNTTTVFYANFGALGATFYRADAAGAMGPPGVYLIGFTDDEGRRYGHEFGDTLFSYIQASADPDMSKWGTLKLQLTPSHRLLYFNNVLVLDIPRNAAVPIANFATAGIGIQSRQGNVDWWKVYDANGQVRYFEDYLDPDNPAMPDPAYLCPTAAPDCQSDFVQYFNQRQGTNYTFSQIDSIFRLNAVPLDICTPSLSCDSLTTIYNTAVCRFNALADETVNTKQCNWGNWAVRGVINASNRGYGTDEIQTPFIINNGIIRMLHPDSSTRYGAISYNSHRSFSVNNEYAFEVRVRNPYGTDVDFFANTASSDDPGYETNEDFYVGFIPQWATGYYQLGGVRYYDSAFGGKDFNTWRIVKYVVKPEKFQVYYEGQLIKELPRDGHHTIIRMNSPWIKANVGENLEIDWMKIYHGPNDSLIFYEDFNGYPTTYARPDPSFLVPRADCKAFFETFFRSRTGKTFSYDQIKTYYQQQCGLNVDFCSSPADLTLCGRTEPVFPPTMLAAIDNCSDSSFFIQSKAQDLYSRYVDSVKGRFDSSYRAKCLQAYKYERFTVRHAVSEYHYTLYYYDQAGNLVKTIPPAGVQPNYDSLWLDSVDIARQTGQTKLPAHALPTQYRYNTLNQVTAQKSPDGGKTEFWYDRLGRLTLSRNARQLAMSGSGNNYYSYTKYDVLGRITEVGQLRDTMSQVITDTFSRNETALTGWHTSLLRNREQVTATIYDIPYDGFIGIDPTLATAQQNVRNRVSYVTYTDLPDMTSAYNHGSFYSYDIHGNVDTLLQDYGQSGVVPNIMNKNGNRWKKLVYEYDLISGKVNKVMYQPRFSDQWTHRYYYDAENRLTEVETSTDGYTWEREAKYEYYLHGPLARTILGQQQVQGIDYAYTLQGWLKGMNSTGATIPHDIGGDAKAGGINQYVARDALGFNLNYFSGDYKSINPGVNPFPGYRLSGGSLPDSVYRPLYNGNISSMATHIRKFDELGHVPIFYNYRYDQLNRLVKQDAFFFSFNASTNSYGSNWTPDSTFHEDISYDPNGNIQHYNRYAIGAGSKMDGLTYKYYPGSNKLRQVNDHISAAKYGNNSWDVIFDLDDQTDTSNYIYDEIGNLIQDKQENVTGIKWNVYGKITEVNRTATANNPYTKIIYSYDAQGNRIGKTSYQGNGRQDYTWYVRDAQGNLMSTYTATNPAPVEPANLQTLFLTQADVYIYGSSRLGMLARGTNTVDNGNNTGPWINPFYNGDSYNRGYRQYELTNHLGNVLTVISDRNFGVSSGGSLTLPNGATILAVDYYDPHMVAANDYYPFGMLSRTFQASDKYRFGFNGKEADNEVKGRQNQIDYGARVHDPRIGRFLSVDPLTKDFPWYTPYQFAGNKPIWAIDLDGLEEQTASTYVHKPYASLQNVPKSTSNNTSAGMNLGSFKLDKMSYDYTTWWIPATKAGVFTNNAVVSATNQVIGGLETGSKLLSTKGRKEIRRAAWRGFVKGLIWLGETSNEEKWDYVKDKVTEVNTWEDFAGAMLLTKGVDWVMNPKINIPLSPSFGPSKPFKFAYQFGKCVEFVAEFKGRFSKNIKATGAKVQTFEINIGGGGLIGTAEQQLANNGMHRFVQVTIEGETRIFDNFHPEGISRSEYLKKIGGRTQSGQLLEGEELLKKHTTEIKDGN